MNSCYQYSTSVLAHPSYLGLHKAPKECTKRIGYFETLLHELLKRFD